MSKSEPDVFNEARYPTVSNELHLNTMPPVAFIEAIITYLHVLNNAGMNLRLLTNVWLPAQGN